MTTTRRDLLAAMLAAPLVAALPENAKADEPVAPASPVYLSGFTAFQDYAKPDDVRRMLYGDYEMYADDRKAIFRVVVQGEGGILSWLERVFVQPEEVAMMRELCAMLKEATP